MENENLIGADYAPSLTGRLGGQHSYGWAEIYACCLKSYLFCFFGENLDRIVVLTHPVCQVYIFNLIDNIHLLH